MCDSNFKYFIEKIAAIELDLSFTRCVLEHQVTRRFYRDFLNIDEIRNNPSDHIFTFQMVINYMRQHHKTLKLFRARGWRLDYKALIPALTDPLLDHIVFDLRPLNKTDSTLTDASATMKKLSKIVPLLRLEKVRL